MNCFICATPYHVIAAITMASGMYFGQDATLVVLDHFDINEAMVTRIKNTQVFKEVLLYKSNNKTRWNKVKRLANVFVPDKTMYYLANKTEFEHCVFFALDFLNLGYMAKTYRMRGLTCDFAFGDDGVGAYMNSRCYRPKSVVVNLLKVTGRLSDLESVKRLYVYKPELMVENTSFDLIKIQQSEEIYTRVQRAVSQIFIMDQDIDINDCILYFEQPSAAPDTDPNVLSEQKLLKMAMQKLNIGAVVKMHPRSTAEALWKEFPVMKTRIPFEAMVLQKNCAPAIMMSNCSTAMFSVYLLDHLPVTNCYSIFLNRMVPNQNERINMAMDQYFKALNSVDQEAHLYSPVTEEEFADLLDKAVAIQKRN